jgi:hypothetical protein
VNDEARRTLAAHLVRPFITPEDGPERDSFIVYPMMTDYVSLHQLASDSKRGNDVIAIAQALPNLMRDTLWAGHATSACVDYGRWYVSRLHERFKALARHVKCNGSYLGLGLAVNDGEVVVVDDLIKSFQTTTETWQEVPCRVIHADEHPGNILVGPQGDWFIVDYANVAVDGDWLYSLAKLYYWWRVNAPLQRAVADNLVRQSLRSRFHLEKTSSPVLRFTYDAEAHAGRQPVVAGPLENLVENFAERTAAAMGDKQWRERFPWVYAAVVFGSIGVPANLDNLGLVGPAHLDYGLRALSRARTGQLPHG